MNQSLQSLFGTLVRYELGQVETCHRRELTPEAVVVAASSLDMIHIQLVEAASVGIGMRTDFAMSQLRPLQHLRDLRLVLMRHRLLLV